MRKHWEFVFVWTPVLPQCRQNRGGAFAVGVVSLHDAKERADVVLRKSWLAKRLLLCWHEGPCRSCLLAPNLLVLRLRNRFEHGEVCGKSKRLLVPCLKANLRLVFRKFVTAQTPPLPDALSRSDLRLCMTYLTLVACGKNVESNAKEQPSDLANMHSPCARQTTLRHLRVLRSSKTC